ncbi:MAG: GDP-mannose 4,6-dehydratase [Bacteroidota bacterium]
MPTSVFITGSEGFIGSHLVSYLLEKGYKVKALVLYNSFNQVGWLSEIHPHPKLEIISGDIRDPFLIESCAQEVEAIIHLAALISIPHSYDTPASYVKTNVEGTLNVLEAAKRAGGIKVLTVSSSEVYGSAQYTPIDESHPLVAQSPYSASKIAAEKLTESYYYAFRLPTCIVRPFNTYGPRQSLRAIIPKIITHLLEEKELKLGNLYPTRDFVYVQDTVRAIEEMMLSDRCVGKAINIATGREISIKELVKVVALKLGREEVSIASEACSTRPKDSEVNRLLGTYAYLNSLTGWKPAYDLEKGIKETVKWFKNHSSDSSYQFHL